MKIIHCSLILIHLILFSFENNAQSRYGKMLPKGSIYALNTASRKVYAGIDNPLHINYPLNDCESIFLLTNNGIIYSDNDTTYLMPDRSGKARLRLFTICNQDTVEKGYLFITSESLPYPQLTIDDQIIEENSKLTKTQLLQANKFHIYISDDIEGSENWSEVTSYEFGYNFGGYFISYKSDGNIIDDGAKDFIAKLNPGKLLTLKVRISSTGNLEKYLPLYRITIH